MLRRFDSNGHLFPNAHKYDAIHTDSLGPLGVTCILG